jgi:hypothetical protein
VELILWQCALQVGEKEVARLADETASRCKATIDFMVLDSLLQYYVHGCY